MSSFKKNPSMSPSRMYTPNQIKQFQSQYKDTYMSTSSFTGQNDLLMSSKSEMLPKQLFNANDYATDGITERDVHIYKQAFDLIDQRNEGWLNPGKLRTALKEFGDYNASIELVYQMCSDFDNDMNGKIDFEEFIQMMKMRPCEQDTTEDITKTFKEINQYKENQGITAKDLIELATKCGDVLSMKDAISIIKKLDENGQQISIEDFIHFNKRCEF